MLGFPVVLCPSLAPYPDSTHLLALAQPASAQCWWQQQQQHRITLRPPRNQQREAAEGADGQGAAAAEAG